MENPSAWESQKHMNIIGIALITIGIGIAITVFPAAPILSPLIFALIGGPGVYIGYKLKDAAGFILIGSLIASLVYAWLAFMKYVFRGSLIDDQFFSDFLAIVVPVLAIGILPLAWFRRRLFDGKEEKKIKVPGSVELKKALGVWGFCLLIVVPFAFGFMMDYNQRGDTNPPQVIQLRVETKWIDEPDDHPGIHFYHLQGMILDRTTLYSFRVTEEFYDRHGIGSLVEVKIHEGALGYEWLEWIY